MHPLVCHVADALLHTEQVALLATINDLRREHAAPAPYRYGFDKLFAGAVLDDAHAMAVASLVQPYVPDMPWPFACGLVECLGYISGSSLAPHVDHVHGINVILSLGATARFTFRVGDSGPEQRVALRSGDAIVFPADGAPPLAMDPAVSTAYTCRAGYSNVWHRIESFDDDMPDWFRTPPYVRICVQYRQATMNI